MKNKTWKKDASSLVDAFRKKEISPYEEMQNTIEAIENSKINSVCFTDFERALKESKDADVTKPFGGVPALIKELEPVKGWPYREGSLLFKDRIADHTMHAVDRLLTKGGAVPVGLTTSSEFGGLNVSITKLNGITQNPWKTGRTVGGSSGGAAASVAGGLASLATGSDGGGSIRIPAGYCGLLGMKGTFGRVTRAPHAYMRPNTVVGGILARSVRDVARYYDVVSGVDPFDPSTLVNDGKWEQNLGKSSLKGKKVAVIPSLCDVTLEDGVEALINKQADLLIKDLGLVKVDIEVKPPILAAYWMMENLVTLIGELGNGWPKKAGELTDEVAMGIMLSEAFYNFKTASITELRRIEANEEMARAFEQVDYIIAATNPGPAFPAEATKSNQQKDLLDFLKENSLIKTGSKAALYGARVLSSLNQKIPIYILDEAAKRFPEMMAMGALTMISNVYGNPAVSIPAGFIDALPVGLQVLAPHHRDGELLDIALVVEKERPWPLHAPLD